MTSDLVSLLACRLELAVDKLSSEGLSIKMIKTTPPDRSNGSGIKRVLAIKEVEPGMAEIIWSFENYE